MARHGERIHKRKDGRWEGRYKIGNSENGRTRYASVYGKTYAETKEKLYMAESKAKLPKGDFYGQKNFAYAAEQWLLTNQQTLKKSTMHKYMYLMEKHILPIFGAVRVSFINTAMLNEFANQKLQHGSLKTKNGLSKSYVRSMMLIIDSVMKFSAQKGWCALLSFVYKPRPEKNEPVILRDFEQAFLEKNLILNLSHTSIGILITLQTGLRIGEICALKWDDIDFNNCILHVRSTVSRVKNAVGKGSVLVIDTPKTETSMRAIPFSVTLKKLLLLVREKSVSKYVISEKKDFISPRTFEYRYHKIMQKLNLPKLNYHALRHTFATRCVEYGVDVKSLSEILGHSNVSITLNTYVHSSMELKRTQINKLPPLSA